MILITELPQICSCQHYNSATNLKHTTDKNIPPTEITATGHKLPNIVSEIKCTGVLFFEMYWYTFNPLYVITKLLFGRIGILPTRIGNWHPLIRAGCCWLIAVSPQRLCWWDGLRCACHPSRPLPPPPSPLSLALSLPVASSQDHSLPPSWLIVISFMAGGVRGMILSLLLLGFVAPSPPPHHLSPHSPPPLLAPPLPVVSSQVSIVSWLSFLRQAEQVLLDGGGFGVSEWENCTPC